MRITSLHTKDGETIDLGQFAVLVGPNNVGKSQTLRDIQAKMDTGADTRTTLITGLDLEKPMTFPDLLKGLEVVEDNENIDHHFVRGIRSNLQSGDQIRVNLKSLEEQYTASPDMRFMLGNLARYRVSFLDAASRLAVAQTTSAFNAAAQPPANLLQGLFASPNLESELRKAFKRAFSMDVVLDYSGMVELTLRVAQSFPSIPEDPRLAYH